MLRTKACRLEMLLAMFLGAALVMGEWTIGLRPRQAEQNVQPFTGAIGGLQAPPVSWLPFLHHFRPLFPPFRLTRPLPPPQITNSGDLDRPYEVEGDTFPDFASAASRSCDTQKNDCADAANNGGGFEISECEAQNGECRLMIGFLSTIPVWWGSYLPCDGKANDEHSGVYERGGGGFGE